MAHKTLVGGTAYEIKGGRTLAGGTGYSIRKGRTLVGGTGYDISFKPSICTITFGDLDYIGSTQILIGGTDYNEYDYENTSLTVPYGTVVSGTIEPAIEGSRYTTVHYVQITDAATGAVNKISNTGETGRSYSYTIESDVTIISNYERV